MEHPEGRLLAVQQQMWFAELLAQKLEMQPDAVLRKLALAGLSLTMDINEITLDAAAVMPLLDVAKPKLRAVPKDGE